MIKKFKNYKNLDVFIICSVRGMDKDYLDKLFRYAESLEAEGKTVYLPPRDTNQSLSGLDINKSNREGIKNADEIHVFYNPNSSGTHFDLGQAFAFKKPIKIIEEIELPTGSVYNNTINDWQKLGPG